MGKKVRSAKGEVVDFDYLKIKEQLAAAPTPVEVKNRQNFIENRLKRRIKKKVPEVEPVAVDVEPTLPAATEENVSEESVVEAKAAPVTKKTTTTKQRARKKTT